MFSSSVRWALLSAHIILTVGPTVHISKNYIIKYSQYFSWYHAISSSNRRRIWFLNTYLLKTFKRCTGREAAWLLPCKSHWQAQRMVLICMIQEIFSKCFPSQLLLTLGNYKYEQDMKKLLYSSSSLKVLINLLMNYGHS